MKKCLSILLILLVLSAASLAQGGPKADDWPVLPVSKGSDAFNHSSWFLTQASCAVYLGPGEEYAQDRYATLAADQWVEVFGQENGWALILYVPADNLYRFGYCPVSALPNGDGINPLPLWGDPCGTTSNGWITADPLLSLDETFLPRECPVRYLCLLGDTWLYVELMRPDGKPMRGFILVGSLYEEALFADSPISFVPTPEPTYASTDEPAPSPTPAIGLSESSAVTLAKNVLYERFGYTREQVAAFNINSLLWGGEYSSVCFLIEFYTGDYMTGDHAVSVGIDATTGDLRGCYVPQNGFSVWVEAAELDDVILEEGLRITPAPTPESAPPEAIPPVPSCTEADVPFAMETTVAP